MTVADLQKYLRGLAEALHAGRSPAAKDLADAADRLNPFAPLTVADFAALINLAWEYRTTGKIPALGPAPKGAKAKAPVVAPSAALAAVQGLYARALDPAITREVVEREIGALGSLSKAELDAVAAACGYSQTFRSKSEVQKKLVGYVMTRKGSFNRSDA
jgi:hypothetical protein